MRQCICRNLYIISKRQINKPHTHLSSTSVFSLQSASFKARSVEMESFSTRRKGGCVRQENACLTVQDEQLISDLDAMQYDLV